MIMKAISLHLEQVDTGHSLLKNFCMNLSTLSWSIEDNNLDTHK